MKKFFFLFLLYFFISVIVLLDRSGSLIASVEVGSCLSAAQVVVLYFYELFWKTYRKTIDKQLEK